MKQLRASLIALTSVVLVACSSGALNWPSSYHVVQRGDTLFSIAWQYGYDYRQLAAWNKLGDGTLIYEGQIISLVPGESAGDYSSYGGKSTKSSTTAASSGSQSKPLPAYKPPPEQKVSTWQWPTEGRVVTGYKKDIKTDSGIHIGGRFGQPVVAASNGTVVYAGGALKGYGNLLIIKHNDTYLSAYGFNSEVLVGEGEGVKRGQKIAQMGQTPAGEVILHFEIRKNGKPVNPTGYLPRR